MRQALIFVLVWSMQASPSASDGLTSRVEAILDTPGYQTGRWGLLVVDGKSGQVVYERNADQMFRPASVTKLFSTAAALAELGADYRFVTPVVRRGEVDKEGTLHGDLILLAQGDPSLGGRTGPSGTLLFEDNDHSYAGPNSKSTIVKADPLAGLDHLAREVLASGIKQVLGDVVIDDRLFESARATGSGPSTLSPIVLNDQCVDVVVTPGSKAGEPALVQTVPASSFVTMDAQVETVEPGQTKHVVVRPNGPRRFSVRGRIPADAGTSYHIYEVDEPASFARALFIEGLRNRGVRVAASPLGANDTSSLAPREELVKLPKIAQYTSPPFREYVRVTLKVSQNLHASMLPLLIAAKQGKQSLDEGLTLEGAALKSLGVDIDKISLGSGAGGSMSDLVTPRATVALLKAMSVRSDFPDYLDAMPVLGRDGTLAQAVPEASAARGHIKAKTGTYYVRDGLTGKMILTSKALAGYLETASGRSLIFAFFVNDIPLRVEKNDVSEATAAAGRVLGKLCEAFYDDEGGSAASSPPKTSTEPARNGATDGP